MRPYSFWEMAHFHSLSPFVFFLEFSHLFFVFHERPLHLYRFVPHPDYRLRDLASSLQPLMFVFWIFSKVFLFLQFLVFHLLGPVLLQVWGYFACIFFAEEEFEGPTSMFLKVQCLLLQSGLQYIHHRLSWRSTVENSKYIILVANSES